MATQTRAVLIQFIVGMIAVIIIVYKQSFLKDLNVSSCDNCSGIFITLYFNAIKVI